MSQRSQSDQSKKHSSAVTGRGVFQVSAVLAIGILCVSCSKDLGMMSAVGTSSVNSTIDWGSLSSAQAFELISNENLTDVRNQYIECEGKLYFAGEKESPNDIELWEYDGETIQLTAEINPSGNGMISHLVCDEAEGKVYFAGAESDSGGKEIWRFDARNEISPVRLTDMFDVQSALPKELVLANNLIFFTALQNPDTATSRIVQSIEKDVLGAPSFTVPDEWTNCVNCVGVIKEYGDFANNLTIVGDKVYFEGQQPTGTFRNLYAARTDQIGNYENVQQSGLQSISPTRLTSFDDSLYYTIQSGPSEKLYTLSPAGSPLNISDDHKVLGPEKEPLRVLPSGLYVATRDGDFYAKMISEAGADHVNLETTSEPREFVETEDGYVVFIDQTPPVWPYTMQLDQIAIISGEEVVHPSGGPTADPDQLSGLFAYKNKVYFLFQENLVNPIQVWTFTPETQKFEFLHLFNADGSSPPKSSFLQYDDHLLIRAKEYTPDLEEEEIPFQLFKLSQ